MQEQILIAGLVLTVAGALLSAVADAWLSRLVLVYLDAMEANVGKLAEAVRSGGKHVATTGIDLKRDRRQETARAFKLLGWAVLVLGLATQLAATWWRLYPV